MTIAHGRVQREQITARSVKRSVFIDFNSVLYILKGERKQTIVRAAHWIDARKATPQTKRDDQQLKFQTRVRRQVEHISASSDPAAGSPPPWNLTRTQWRLLLCVRAEAVFTFTNYGRAETSAALRD